MKLLLPVMLATADDVDGLPGHVSGCTQSTLFIFMYGVQIALTVQEWLLHGVLNYVESVNLERFVFEECKSNTGNDQQYSLLHRLSYAMLLLFLQICINPFIFKSQRNYREGLLFCLGSIFIVMVWIGWITMYIIMGKDYGIHWYDKAVSTGLLGCSAALIVAIFVPKVSMVAFKG